MRLVRQRLVLFSDSISVRHRLLLFLDSMLVRQQLILFSDSRPVRQQILLFSDSMVSVLTTTIFILRLQAIGGRVRLRPLEISSFWFEVVLAASGASKQDVRGVYGCIFSWRFKWNYRPLCPTSAAGDTAVLVFGGPKGLRGLWLGCVRCLWMRLFRWHQRRPHRTPAAGEIAVFLRQYPCSCQAVLQKEQTSVIIVDTGEKIVPRCCWSLSEITKKLKIYYQCQ
jgi:hypothetical protein